MYPHFAQPLARLARWQTFLFALLLVGMAVGAHAQAAGIAEFTATVVRVKDGDSVLVERLPMKRISEIRLAGMDAPELGQPWGIQSRAALKRLIEGKKVRVVVTDRDRYSRLVGKLWIGRVYVNAYMTEQGHAWAFDRYMKDGKIRAGQIAARAAGRGLWSLPEREQMPPATWRQQNPRRHQG